MGKIEELIKEYTKQILWVASAIIALYTFNGGTVSNWSLSNYANGKYLIIGLIILNLYIALKLYEAIIIEKTKPPKIVFKQPENKEPKPFDFTINEEETE